MALSSESDSAVVRRWSRRPGCVGQARADLRTALAGWGLSYLTDAAVLILSELLTNAGRHAVVSPGREIETRFLVGGGVLRIEVHDASSVPPRMPVPDLEAPGGRGLLLVAALADDWGFGARLGPGKVVWAELALGGGGARRGT
ncbi:ATP-binding protein [Streptomyces sp. NBC_01387]|uniref:ATP-binding protein n=1 Tax=unclassified Streptomyces TaxID=2593676 RepID=UPI0020257548|nr:MULTISPECIES: ATP-binding protein [unclassified Streptomyces]MCX4550428.1 ATP-binding protein [Streptomyces sp. NBC_01500]WSC21882.1 ATP-binding protein [Streptomyces sp. NBC_01766]WSV55837.1 ATP-binding protein [Streptomyces sp. NBC_01014]